MCTVCSQAVRTGHQNDDTSATFGLSSSQYTKLMRLMGKSGLTDRQTRQVNRLKTKANSWATSNGYDSPFTGVSISASSSSGLPPWQEVEDWLVKNGESVGEYGNRRGHRVSLKSNYEAGDFQWKRLRKIIKAMGYEQHLPAKEPNAKSGSNNKGSNNETTQKKNQANARKTGVQWSQKKWKDFKSSGRFTGYQQMDPAAIFGAKQVLKRFGDYFYQRSGHHGWRSDGGGYSYHPNGQAVDLMIPNDGRTDYDVAMGDKVAKFVSMNADALGVDYILWRGKVWNVKVSGDQALAGKPVSSWRDASERGSWTANHMDHLHINFWDNTNNYGGKIKELSGGYTDTNPGKGGKNYNNPDGYVENPEDAANAQRELREMMAPYKSNSARKSFANTLQARLGFSEEEARKLARLVKKAKSQDEAMGLIYASPIYKNRFIGNEMRKENGLPPIQEGDYIALERRYAEILQQNGVGRGIFDREDYATWMANDISATEVTERIAEYGSIVNEQWDDSMKQAMKQLYGMTEADFLSFAMKPTEGTLQKLKKRVRALEIADAALEEGFGGVLGKKADARQWAERLAQSGDSGIDPQSVFSDQRRWNESGSNEMYRSLGFEKRTQREQIEDQMGVPGQSGMSERDRRRKMKKVYAARGQGSGGSGIQAMGDESFDTSF